jgi:hypothetical protein
MMAPAYTTKTALEQIDKCDFECEGGPLANNAAYRWLKEHFAGGPAFALGQWVQYEVPFETNGIKVSQKVRLCVVSISMSSDTERRTWTYSLSTDPPRPYHYGTPAQFVGVRENLLLAEVA